MGPFHRERKQLTGVLAYQTQKRSINSNGGGLDAYMRHELLQPALAFA